MYWVDVVPKDTHETVSKKRAAFMNNRLTVVLAAGKGTRMNTDMPKVAVGVCGRPMIDYVLDALEACHMSRIVVVIGYGAEIVREVLSLRKNVEFVVQEQQLGTGHAVQMCHRRIAEHIGPVLVVAGDSPLIQTSSINSLLELYECEHPACILGTAHKDNPHGLGRIVRDEDNNFLAIVEEKDATDLQRKITEVNMSTYVFDNVHLQNALTRISNENQQSEYFLTDCPGVLKQLGHDVRAMPVLKPCETLSINTLDELKIVEAEMQRIRG